MPILKQLGPALPKKRLDRDAISAPLGDFRHTMHVGRGGDAFGDTSFLSRHGGEGGGPTPSPGPSPGPSPAPSAAPSPARPALPPPTAPQPPRPSESQSESRPAAADPFLSFHLDLGPSLLEEVLGVMDRGALADAGAAPSAHNGGLLTSQPGFGSEEDLDEVIGL
ncbi:cdc42 effector protein 5 [Phascolarctos cinereus]|uniref:Cdc42 effector protein 5 n=1 Tax=Phascolarctos cinereus TaxID=38626 RepID=A0A6P5LUU8_PHACI|nr:cdc42 effector protein 5 [Phascolarctos cinereus]XP_020859856.1 cdc42 effector protein 5 [Phascolarctos cinereus]XP_020859857.1 cdc42 effector protein 5 [Phascolarctos cinereus]